MSYEVGFKPSALRQIRKLENVVQEAIVAGIEPLVDNPRPDGCKKLKGETNLYRIRVAKIYRIIYEIQDRKLLITVHPTLTGVFCFCYPHKLLPYLATFVLNRDRRQYEIYITTFTNQNQYKG
jgi:mRNA interferase RelE/StbE